ncbi:MAG TPA: adenylate kinase family protein [Methanoregulaceae archaeon]|nr:adenylate kinase family protein [Methanoregulaceae archaeon]
MMVGIAGTPGTGKTALGDELARRGERVVRVAETVGPFVVDEVDGVREVDEEAWSAAFEPVDGYVEGGLAHLLPCDRLVILRCRPDELERRLNARGYPPAKVRENVEAEALDVVLCEALERHPPDRVLEIETTDRPVGETADLVAAFVAGREPPSHGRIDFSGYLVVGP